MSGLRLITQELLQGRAHLFWIKVNKAGPLVRDSLGPCWQWKASVDGNGYGQFGAKLHDRWRMLRAHRVAWVLSGNPDTGYLMHGCDNRRCVRPAHLRPGTHAKNMQEMWDRGRGHGRSKLTPEQATKIKEARARGVPIGRVAKSFGVSVSYVSQVAHGKMWKHLP